MYSTMRGFIIDFAASLRQRSPNGRILDPVIEEPIRLHFQPAVGGSVSVTGCGLGPLDLTLTSATDSLVPVVGPDDSYYFPQVGSPFVHDRQPDSWPAPPPAPYILTVSHAGQGIVTQDVDVHADQPTDFVDIAGDIADRDHDDIPDCWEIANPPFSPDDSTDADIPPSISSVTPTSGIQGDTISSLF